MARYYYGTVPALAWILNHYFFGRVHYSWLAEEFCPLLTNPKSSNPYLIYGDLMWAWVNSDRHDKFVGHSRVALQDGVDAYEERGTLDAALADRLRLVCEDVPVSFFYPLVYRVNLDAIPADRQTIAGSGLAGSRECLVRDLQESEFELCLADNRRDAQVQRLLLDGRPGAPRTSPVEALRILEASVHS
jgi:hypothetical protein